MHNRFKELRKRLGLTQTGFGDKLGKTITTIQYYEYGTRKITDGVLLQLNELFNVNIDWMRTGVGDMFLPKPGGVSFNISTLRQFLHLTVEEFAKDIGYDPELLTSWESGKQLPEMSALQKISEVYGVNVSWLISGIGEMFNAPKADDVQISRVVTDGERAVCLRYFPEVKASAGFGLPALDETYEDLCLDVSFVRNKTRDVIINVEGDSMSPTLLDKDKILVSTDVLSLQGLIPGNIYVLRIGDDVVIKRYIKRNGAVCIFRGDNPSFPEISADLSDEHNQIVGIPRSIIYRRLQKDLEDEEYGSGAME